MAKFEVDGIDEVMSDFENIDDIPFTVTCSICGMQFEATQDELLDPTVTCPHCGAELGQV